MRGVGDNPAILFEPLPEIEGGWPCIHADVPLLFRSNSASRPGRNALRHYPCLKAEELATLPVKGIAARDGCLWFWVPGPFLAIGAHVPIMRAWGFQPTAMGFVWVKTNPQAPTLFFTERDLFFGPGLTTRKNCEYVILGRRGNPKRLARDVFEVVIAPRRQHSRKPDEVYFRIERYCAGPRLDLFARASRPGWTTWGDQARLYDPQEPAGGFQRLPAAEPCRQDRGSPPAASPGHLEGSA
jgi:N6-adenosine-specific RNA methylase IME4